MRKVLFIDSITEKEADSEEGSDLPKVTELAGSSQNPHLDLCLLVPGF